MRAFVAMVASGSVAQIFLYHEVHEGRMQTEHLTAYAGSGLKPLMIREGTTWRAQPYWGKPAVRNDRGDRGDVGIIRSPVRASILPD